MSNRKSKKDTIVRKCKLCGRKFVGKAALIDHIGNVHKSSIPEGWSPSRYENFLRTGKTEGHCVQCGEPTDWNESTWKYHRICKKKSCRDACAKTAKKNMVGMYGKEHLLDDPDMQKKMVYAKSTSKQYKFEDPDDPSITYIARADSSYGLDFFEMLDVFLNFNGRDIIAPSPNVYWYEYEGKMHFYIPDAYIISLNLEVELKDGGENPNLHPKIQAVDKEKERLKDEVMYSLRDQVNYIKIVNKDYSEFFAMLGELKARDIVYSPKWVVKNKNAVQEAASPMEDVVDTVAGAAKKERILTSRRTVTYSELVLDLKNDIDGIKSEKEYRMVEYTVYNVKEHLSGIANSKTLEGERLSHEASKAIKIIDNTLIPRLNNKARILKIEKEKKPVAEAFVPTMDLLDPTKWQPVYVFLSKTGTLMSNLVGMYTKDPFTHSSFSFDETMTDMYSFTDLGMEHENIKTRIFKKYEETTSYRVYAMMVPTDSKTQLHTLLSIMQESRKDYRYSLKGVIQVALKLGKDTREYAKFCSQFVGEVMQMIYSDIINKDPFYVKPMDFTNMRHLFLVNEGDKLKDYDPEKTKRNLIEKIRKGDFEV